MRVPAGSSGVACALWACGLLCAQPGCGDGAAEEPVESSAWTPKSGSRLKTLYLVDGEGARLFAGWYDETRGEYCRVARAEGGRYYCFPYGNPAVYSDAGCKRPLGVHGACVSKYTAARRGDIRCDNETLALWEEEGEVVPAGIFNLGNDLCRPGPAVFGSSLVATSRRLAESQLVGGETRPPRTDLRLASRVVRFEDGAVAPAMMIDGRWERRCSPALTSEGIRCVPEAAVFVGTTGPYYDDSTCTALVAHADAPACLVPKVVLRAELADGCTRITGAFSLGPRRNPREVYATAECLRGRSMPGHFYKVGAPLELTAFPALQVEERGSGRIRVRTFATGDGAPAPYLGVRLFDATLDLSCRVVPAADGVLRCLPVDGPALIDGQASGARFADAACATPLARMGAPADCMAPTSPAMMAVQVSERTCAGGDGSAGSLGDLEPGRWEVRRLGSRHAGPIFQRSAAGCTEATPGEALYALGDIIPPATFAAFRPE